MILVTGTGRSGTSTVAKVLHEHGISMGTSFRASNQHDSGCTYEDLECKRINAMFLRHEINYNEYIEKLCVYGKQRGRNGEWGVKHPEICYVIGIYLQVFSPIVIRCNKERENVVEECIACYGFSEKKAGSLYDTRTAMLDSALARMKHLEIDFTGWIEEDEIWRKINDYLGNRENFVNKTDTTKGVCAT